MGKGLGWKADCEVYFPCRSKLWLATVWREGLNERRGEEPIAYWNLLAGDYPGHGNAAQARALIYGARDVAAQQTSP
jgi:hypothetical protein